MRIEQPAAEYDIVVVGAGMVGASFACLLQQALGESTKDVRTLIVDAVAPSAPAQPSFDARSTALSYGSRKIFQRMGLWQELEPQATAITEIQVSDQGHFGSARLSHSEHHQDALGYVIENHQLGRILNPRLDGPDWQDLEYLAPAQITAVQPLADGMRLDLASDGHSRQVLARLVVLADGGRSPICAQLGIEQKRKDYGQSALIANIGFSKAHNNVAYERFTDTGPLAVLPLPDFEGQHRGALVWTVNSTEVDELLAGEDEQLLQLLGARFGKRLGRIEQIGQRAAYPLNLSVAKESVRPHLVLLGNVAHTLHPVAGQGLNLALRASECLVDNLQAAFKEGIEPGSMSILQRYQEQRQTDQQLTITLTDQMIQWFSNNDQSRVAARKLGLLAIDLLPGIRKGFARQAMGMHF